ncbi:MAG: hypothetical protein LBF84_00275 [Holosporales bacterium]|nr:hypothetical protein [Holosporales bacterium]
MILSKYLPQKRFFLPIFLLAANVWSNAPLHVIDALENNVAVREGVQTQYGQQLFKFDSELGSIVPLLNPTPDIGANGQQPSLETCIEESFAMYGIDNFSGKAASNDPVTQWYCTSFFQDLTHFGLLTSRAGLDASKPIVDISGILQEQQDIVRNTFQKIASNPVGRMLLYRILLEILRGDGRNQGCVEPGIPASTATLFRRNIARRLGIKWLKNNNVSPEFSILNIGTDRKACIKLNQCSRNVSGINPTFMQNLRQKRQRLGFVPTAVDVCFFHEMVHWFHELRHPDRREAWTICNLGLTPQLTPRSSDDFGSRVYLGKYYYNWKEKATANDLQRAIQLWSGRNNSPNFEEMLTIWGGGLESWRKGYNGVIDLSKPGVVGNGVAVVRKSANIPISYTAMYCYLAGDELSENAYRRASGLDMRCYHQVLTCMEETELLARVYESTEWLAPLLGAWTVPGK